MSRTSAVLRSSAASNVSIDEMLEFLEFRKKKGDTYETLRGEYKLIIRHSGPGPITHPRRPLRCERRYLGKSGENLIVNYQNILSMVIKEIPEKLAGFEALILPTSESSLKPACSLIKGVEGKTKIVPTPEYKAWVIELWKAVIRAVAALPNRQV
jgi:hypothetical protein